MMGLSNSEELVVLVGLV